jgi:hypothetical protein
MSLNRRSVTLGLLCTPLLSTYAHARSARRTFSVVWKGDPIGTQSLSVTRSGSALDVAVDIDIAVKVLGVTAYSYKMQNRERWEGDTLISMSASTRDGGKKSFAKANRKSGKLMVNGSGFSGEVPGDAVTTTYWSPAFLKRGDWISSQTGKLLKVKSSAAGKETLKLKGGAINASRYRVRGSGGFAVDLFYAGGEFAGTSFDARGEPGMVVADRLSPKLSALWSA